MPEDPRVEEPTARILTDLRALAAEPGGSAGARWRLAEPGRQLDANLVHLPAGQTVDTHTEPDLDVVLVVVAGGGTVGAPDRPEVVAEGNLVWLPRGSTRTIGSGPDGLSYLTVHRRRPGMQIKPRPT